MISDYYMPLAQGTFFIGTLFLIKKILKNRNSIKDFDTIGSLITFVGAIFMGLALYTSEMYGSVLLSIPGTLFWGFVFVFSIKHK
mgnify:CR=1 FL=1